MLAAAANANAPLLLLTPDLTPQRNEGDAPGEGFAPHWIDRLLAGVTEHGQDLVLARFDRHHLTNPVESLVAAPVLAGVFGLRLAQPSPFVCALSLRGVHECLDRCRSWTPHVGTHGFDTWLTTEAIVTGLKVSEAPLGLASFQHAPGTLKLMFRQTTQVLFEQCLRHAPSWLELGETLRSPHRLPPFLETLPPLS
jgi:hypothetical protein